MNPLNQGHLSVGRSPLAGAAECPRKMPSWSHSALWEPNMPGVRHECTPLTAVPNQGVGSVWVFIFVSSVISCVQVLAQCLTISQIILSVSACSHPFLFLSGLGFPSRKRSSFLSAVSHKPALMLCSVSTQVLVCGPFHWQQDEKIKNKKKVYH